MIQLCKSRAPAPPSLVPSHSAHRKQISIGLLMRHLSQPDHFYHQFQRRPVTPTDYCEGLFRSQNRFAKYAALPPFLDLKGKLAGIGSIL